ncbi:MAG: alanine racemase, partial [Acutalibacteraceae bacterium]|nr:alanine racemase [Acutalibacteraceae bacterium]
MSNFLKRTWAQISLDNISHNFHSIKSMLNDGVKVMSVVKADAYGHGAVRISKTLAKLGADYLAVSSLDEAEELRLGGIDMP